MNKENSKIAIIGLGYVGLPLAIEFGKKYKVLGFDINHDRIVELSSGKDRTKEADLDGLKHTMDMATRSEESGLKFSSKVEDLKSYNVYIVTVPTPIYQFKVLDLKPLLKASEMLGKVLKKGDIVIYESTVYPGCTEEDCVPVLEQHSGLKFNQDFYFGYSPERINPGDKVNTLTKIKKVTSESTPGIAELVDQLYKSIITAGTHKAPSLKATVLGVPCLTLRTTTERPETCTLGTNELIGTSREKLFSSLDILFRGEWKKGVVPEFWDGKTSNRIVEKLVQLIR